MHDSLPIAIGFLTLSFGLFVYFIGFTDFYDKRLLDCTPISRCRSVALGPVVVNGKVTGPNPIPSLIGHLPSFISRVEVEAYQSNGKSRNWRTVHRRELRMPFYVQDATGEIKVEPAKAVLWLERDIRYSYSNGSAEYSPAASLRSENVIGSLDEMFQEYCLTRGIDTRNPLRFTETNLSPGDPVFVYGTASPNRESGSTCTHIVRKTFWQTPYILEGGKDDMLRKLRTRGFLRVLLGSICVVIASVLLADAAAPAGAQTLPAVLTSDTSRTALIGSSFALVVIGIVIYSALIYNGLVSLRNEVDRAFSNIDVLLQQRFDLIPNLVSVCKAYIEHESSIMQAVSASRSHWDSARGRIDKLNVATGSIAPVRQLLAIAESYPRLRANENFLQLQSALTSIEEQIADRRELYNAAVSLFNSRIQVLPDRLIAGPLRFTEQPFFSANTAAEAVPLVNTNRM